MNTLRCSSCGLDYLIGSAACPRCGLPASSHGSVPMPLQGSVLQGTPGSAPYGLGPIPNAWVASPGQPQTGGVWRQGDVLVVHKGAYLPDRCMKCNAPATGARIDRRFYWHPPYIYLLLFAGVLPYLIVSLMVRKDATLALALCEEHKVSNRAIKVIGAFCLLAVSFTFFIAAIAINSAAVGVIGVPILIVAFVLAISSNIRINVKQIDDNYVWLGGLSPGYLQSFPAL